MAISLFDGLVLDTSAYSQMSRRNSEVLDLIANAKIIYLPTIVIGELEAGFALGTRGKENRATLSEFLSEPFVETVSPSLGTARRYGQVFSHLRKAGTPIPTNDIWIAATALAKACPLLPFDQHFGRIPFLECSILPTNS